MVSAGYLGIKKIEAKLGEGNELFKALINPSMQQYVQDIEEIVSKVNKDGKPVIDQADAAHSPIVENLLQINREHKAMYLDDMFSDDEYDHLYN